jgi:hypothetical protein
MPALFYPANKDHDPVSQSHGKSADRASLLFAYGCYGIIYLMYYIFKTQQVADTFLIYFLVVTISSFLLSAGIIMNKKGYGN